jgi:hypothetical protein
MNPWIELAVTCLIFTVLLPLRGWKKQVEQEKAQRAAELAQDRAEETPEQLIPATLIEIPSPQLSAMWNYGLHSWMGFRCECPTA